ncbi:hypothetical protein WICPIJ_009641, partial [Wickerhamomyces pijperi]
CLSNSNSSSSSLSFSSSSAALSSSEALVLENSIKLAKAALLDSNSSAVPTSIEPEPSKITTRSAESIKLN